MIVIFLCNVYDFYLGLLGNFDKNSSNDFKAPNGDILAADSVEKDIYTYGKKCELYFIPLTISVLAFCLRT